MSFTQIRVTGKYIDKFGSPAKGRLKFLLSAPLQNSTSGEIAIPMPVRVELDENGAFETTLIATDDPGVQPSGVTYLVSEKVGEGRTYRIEVPHNSPGGTLDLAHAAPVANASVIYGVTLDTAQRISARKTHSADVRFATGNEGIVMVDRETGARYRLFVSDGVLGLEALP
jgi:hypothetical protein